MRKFKGGGSSGPTETRVTQTDLPEYVQPYFERLLKRSEADSIQGYQPYGGQRLAYFSPDEMQSQAMTRGYANQVHHKHTQMHKLDLVHKLHTIQDIQQVMLHKAIKLEQLDLPIKQVLTIKDTKLDLLMQDILLVIDKLAMILQ
jgi:hypothetical protein